jgi:HlyD family secretion protein
MRLLLVVCCWFVGLAACQQEPKNDYTLHTLDTGAITQTVSATGHVTARTRVEVGSQVSGSIRRVHVDFNSPVKQGDVLAELEPRLFAAQLARSEAALAVAEAEVERATVNLADAQRNAARHQQLLGADMVARAEAERAGVQRDVALAALKSARASVLQAQADRAQYTTNLALATIRSPIDGVVIDRQVEPGQTVAAQFQVATLFVVVGELVHMHVIAHIDEADVAQVHPGMPVQFHVDAYPQHTFEGTVRTLRQAPDAAPGSAAGASAVGAGTVVTYSAVIEADNPDGRLRQGMTAQAVLVVAQRDQAVRLPPAALRFVPAPAAGVHSGTEDDPDTSTAQAPSASMRAQPGDAAGAASTDVGTPGTVYVWADGRLQPRTVRLGISDGRYTEVCAGLAAGEAVVVGQTDTKKGRRRGWL